MKVAPSMLSADFSKLKEEVIEVTEYGADLIHLDIMDGHFVPNITFGPLVVKALRPYTKIPFDVHLMIENPDKYIEAFVNSGADIITVHVETCIHLHRTVQQIKSYGIKAGVVLNPHTQVESIKHLLPLCDLILIMSVNPGFGGQTFIDFTLDKINALAKIKAANNYHYLIEVDGGINAETGLLCKNHGADILVAGSYIFNSDDRKKRIRTLKLL